MRDLSRTLLVLLCGAALLESVSCGSASLKGGGGGSGGAAGKAVSGGGSGGSVASSPCVFGSSQVGNCVLK
jgi:hypothetical protein